MENALYRTIAAAPPGFKEGKVNKSLIFWSRWLFTAGLFISAFGLLFALFNGTALFGWMDAGINPSFWEGGSLPEGAVTSFKQWIYGVLGATILGWGIFVVFIARYPFRNCERWAWTCIAAGVSAWYVTDSALSLYYGVVFNAAFNTLFLAMVALPLLFTRRQFFSGKV